MTDKKPPQLYIIAGPNGAGKTTFAKKFLPQYAKCQHFVNADLIAQGLSPFSPQVAVMKAGRILLEQIHDFSEKEVDFSFETTLSGKIYVPFFKKLWEQGYFIHLFFLWVPTAEVTLARIRERVAKGGHNIPPKDARRRFQRSIKNFLTHYHALVHSWMMFDNSVFPPHLIAKSHHEQLEVMDESLYTKLVRQYR